MKFPDLPRTGQPVIDTFRQIINYLRSSRVVSINGVQGKTTTNGTTFNIPIEPATPAKGVILPFQISASAALLKAAPGVLDGVSIAATEQATPADGVWYCQAKIVINSTTGAVSSRTVGWSQTYQTNTTTDFYGDIGEIEYIAGAPDMDLLVQYNYGPLLMVLHGAVSEKWALRIY